MAYNHEYPYVDPNRYNSDWELNEVKALRNEMETFEALNKITFSGEWDITKQYPAWTIVNDNNGTEGYISIQPVPAGVTIDNTDYWRFVANYTNVLADLQNRVIDIENNIGDLSDLYTVQKDSVVDAINEAYQMATVPRHKFWYIGDSFLYNSSGWGDQLDALYGVSDSLKTCEGGIGFNAAGQDTGLTIPNLVATVTPDDDVTDVIIYAGVNDCTSARYQVQQEVKTTLETVRAKLPFAKIWIAFNGTYNSTGYGNLAVRYNYIGDVYHRVKWGALWTPGVKFMEGPTFQIQNQNFVDSNGVHPTTIGYALIARCMANILDGGSDTSVEYKYMEGPFNFYICSADNKIGVEIPWQKAIFYDPNNPVTFTAYTFSDIRTIAPPVLPKEDGQIEMFVYCRFIKLDLTEVYEWATVRLDWQGHIWMAPVSSIASVRGIVAESPVKICVRFFNEQHNL